MLPKAWKLAVAKQIKIGQQHRDRWSRQRLQTDSNATAASAIFNGVNLCHFCVCNLWFGNSLAT
jgi:hypothetical protein